ncbi:hypothetical protein Y032_0022g594 [Ancylostoma ceylanicum]|uniref:Uncharacterized protein n=1 Tax=Ancylostoma ceylanicum TaxID=53326 RepID=A0A016V0V2_9BILA|nr:hypothetical protein Y032_0022g594 [Ancylostoma ceylanicum]
MRSFFAVILALIVAAVAVASANPLVYRAPQVSRSLSCFTASVSGAVEFGLSADPLAIYHIHREISIKAQG